MLSFFFNALSSFDSPQLLVSLGFHPVNRDIVGNSSCVVWLLCFFFLCDVVCDLIVFVLALLAVSCLALLCTRCPSRLYGLGHIIVA